LEGGLKNLWSFYTYSIGGVPAVDKIYKYEKLEKELERLNHDLNLREQIKLPEKRIKENNKRKRYHDIIDLETRKILKITFARELELLHYDY
jgi:transcription elongation GreA/GreB family factor